MRLLNAVAIGVIIPLTSLFAAAHSPARAEAVMVTIRVMVLPERKPIAATVVRVTKDRQSPMGEVDKDGKLQFPETNCSADTTYVVTPIPDGDYDSRVAPEKWCGSSDPLEFEFYKTRYAAAVAPVILGAFPDAWNTVAGVPDAFKLIGKYVGTGDYGTAAILGAEAATRLRADNQPVIAKTYEEIAAFYGLAAIADETKDYGNIYRYDPDQSRFVVSASGMEAIRDYQKSFGLKVTGTLDWQTLTSQSELAKTDPMTLFEVRNQMFELLSAGPPM